MTRDAVVLWVADYERVWRSPGTDRLREILAPDVTYVPSPWTSPIRGLDQLGEFWESERAGFNESFAIQSHIVAVEGTCAVVRVAVQYGDQPASRWRDLWVLTFAQDRRCRIFEEWPFAPDQVDGHGTSSP